MPLLRQGCRENLVFRGKLTGKKETRWNLDGKTRRKQGKNTKLEKGRVLGKFCCWAGDALMQSDLM